MATPTPNTTAATDLAGEMIARTPAQPVAGLATYEQLKAMEVPPEDRNEHLPQSAPAVQVVTPPAQTQPNTQQQNQPAQPNTQPPAQNQPATALVLTPESVITEAVIDQVMAKVNSGAELNATEAILFGKINQMATDENFVPPGQEEKTWNVAGKVIGRKEFEDEIRKKYGFGQLKINEDAILTLIDQEAQVLNKDEANRSIDTGFKQNAEERLRLEVTRTTLATEKKKILNTIAEAEQVISILSEAVKNPINTDDLYDQSNRIDMVKFAKASKLINAPEELLAAQQKLNTAKAELEQAQANETFLEIEAFVAAHPEYTTSKPMNELAKDFNNGVTLSEDDELRLMEIRNLMFQSRQGGSSLESTHRYAARVGNLAIKKSSAHAGNQQNRRRGGQTPTPALPNVPTEKQLLEQRIAELKRKISASPTNPGSASGGQRLAPTTVKPSPAMQMIQEGRQYAIGNTSGEKDAALKELGY